MEITMSTATATIPASIRFTALQKQHLEHLAHELNRRTGASYEVHFDSTDAAEEWAMYMDDNYGVLQVLAGTGTDGGGHVLVDGVGHMVSTKKGTLDYERLIQQAKKFLIGHRRAAKTDPFWNLPAYAGRA
jgi:hypothetical protein